ncbi:tRNA (adenosine(37)-N6)-threonylcarbamoyltransferase complex dimerization subunit type 1 TsaB [Acidisoma sp.]|uniref:tRNA (adenosine(37)-N6)-threonylcarbamoyltransferase complex dimerization subunit type 1 TsaB n=1 Tax=Acidisoma sp. TaxID=1872115 RepID=UPI003B00D15B
MPSPQPHLVLGLDASSSRCSVVLWSEDQGCVLAGIEREGPTGDAARLPGMVAELLASRGLAVKDLSIVAVSVGPGSFTGLRASLAFGQGLAAGAGIRVIGVTVAEALAVAARGEAGIEAGLPLWCALDGRQGRLFLQCGGAPEAWEVVSLTDPPRPQGPIGLTGDAAAALGSVLRERGAAALITNARVCHAREVAIAGVTRAQGHLAPLAATPLYIDPPRALPPKGGLRPPPREAAQAS